MNNCKSGTLFRQKSKAAIVVTAELMGIAIGEHFARPKNTAVGIVNAALAIKFTDAVS